MSPTNMLELQKIVLENVSDNSLLFEKELKKSFRWLEKDDLIKLYLWTTSKYNNKYATLIKCVYLGYGFASLIGLSHA